MFKYSNKKFLECEISKSCLAYDATSKCICGSSQFHATVLNSSSLRRWNASYSKLAHEQQWMGWHRLQLLHWRYQCYLWRTRLEPSRRSRSKFQLTLDWILFHGWFHKCFTTGKCDKHRSSFCYLLSRLGTVNNNLQSARPPTRHSCEHCLSRNHFVQQCTHLAKMVLSFLVVKYHYDNCNYKIIATI